MTSAALLFVACLSGGLKELASVSGSGSAFTVVNDSVSLQLEQAGSSKTLAPGAGLTFTSGRQIDAGNASLTWAVAGGGTLTALYTLEPEGKWEP